MRYFASLVPILMMSSLLVLAGGSSGCVVRAHGQVRPAVVVVDPVPVGVVVIEEPPPPRYVQVQPRSGFVYIQGRWDRRGNQWYWRDGYWARERADAYYRPGRWQRNNRGHVWIEGRWEARGRVRVRGR
jgi:WXXGXW repeat (2 copies)